MKVPVAKLAVGLVVLAVALLSGPTVAGVVVAGLILLLLAGWAARDLLVPVRLAADPHGVTVVTGLATRQTLDWSQVRRVRVDARRRSRMLEVDSGETLYLFSRYDLDADLDQVADQLRDLAGPERLG